MNGKRKKNRKSIRNRELRDAEILIERLKKKARCHDRNAKRGRCSVSKEMSARDKILCHELPDARRKLYELRAL